MTMASIQIREASWNAAALRRFETSLGLTKTTIKVQSGILAKNTESGKVSATN